MTVGEERERNKHHLRIMNEANERGTHVGDVALDGLVCGVCRVKDGRQNFIEVVLLW
jgi:hypothetical protein